MKLKYHELLSAEFYKTVVMVKENGHTLKVGNSVSIVPFPPPPPPATPQREFKMTDRSLIKKQGSLYQTKTTSYFHYYDDLVFYISFTIIHIISRQWKGDNEVAVIYRSKMF